MTWKKNILNRLADEFGLLTDEPLKKHIGIGMGGPADLLALPENKRALQKLVKQASLLGIPVTVFGSGTNVMVPDKGIQGLVILTKHLKSRIRIYSIKFNQKMFYIEAGERVARVSRFALIHSYTSLEFLAGIPGTIAGAVSRNTGTKTWNMSDIIASIHVLDPVTMEFETIKRENLDFSDRHLNFSGIILGATLNVKKADPDKIKILYEQNMKQNSAWKKDKNTTADGFFINRGNGLTARELIEKSGLKGFKMGSAMISDHNADHIVNTGNATCNDILVLTKHVQKIVFDTFGVKLETDIDVLNG